MWKLVPVAVLLLTSCAAHPPSRVVPGAPSKAQPRIGTEHQTHRPRVVVTEPNREPKNLSDPYGYREGETNIMMDCKIQADQDNIQGDDGYRRAYSECMTARGL